MNERKKRLTKKYKPATVFLTGFVTLLVLIGLVVTCVVLFTRGATPPDMLLPDGVEGDSGDPPASLVPHIANLQPGDYIYDGLLSILAKQDMPPFASADELPDEQLISFGIWAMLIDNTAYERYALQEDGTMLIPAKDVAESIVAHFDLTRTVENRTTEVYSEFIYSPESASYVVPVYGADAAYLPRVRAVSVAEDGTATVDLDYYSTADLAEDGSVPDGLSPAKCVRIRLSGSETDYKVLSIEALALPENG